MSIILDALKVAKKKDARPQSASSPEGDPGDGGKKRGPLHFFKTLPLRTQVLLVVTVSAGIFAGVFWIDTLMEKKPDVAQPTQETPQADLQRSVAEIRRQEKETQPPSALKATIEDAPQLYASGLYDESLEVYKKELETHAESYALHNNVGLIYLKKELYSNALQSFNEALAINSECVECLNNLGYLKTMLDQGVEAEKYLQKAIRINSAYADPYFNLAVIREKSGDIGTAVQYYKRFSELTQDQDNVLVARVNKRIQELTLK